MDDAERPRPRTRGECVDGPRPCPWLSCRHHLGLVRVLKTGELRLQARSLEQLVETCALDAADNGEHNASDLADLLGVSRKTVHEEIASALSKVRKSIDACR